jgi:hypothetical protein
MSEEVARLGGPLVEEDSKLSRRRRTALGNGECWRGIHPVDSHLGIVILVRRAVLAAKAYAVGPTADPGGSDAGPRLGVAWSGNELVFNPRRRRVQGLHGLLDHGRPCWWGRNRKRVSYRRGR